MKRRRFLILALCVAILLSTIGCGGSAGNFSAGESGGSAAPSAPADIAIARPEAPMETAEAEEDGALRYSVMADSEVNGIAHHTEEYSHMEENGFAAVSISPLSTFAADVDTASYANLRRMLLAGEDVPADAVRIEEMINYFHYDYPEPAGNEPFSVSTELTPCPWNPDHTLLRIGLQASQPDWEAMPASNLVFLIDVSGSMDQWNKLPLVKQAFLLLTENLGPEDTISIVTYASSDRIVLDGAGGDEPSAIQTAIEALAAGGSTAGRRASRPLMPWRRSTSSPAETTGSSWPPTAI